MKRPQVLQIWVGQYTRCGGCGEGIRKNTTRCYLYRGGTNPKAFHFLCALQELNLSINYLLKNMKELGTTKHTMYHV